MSTSKAQHTLLEYANEMLALERDIKEAVDRQSDDEGVLKQPQVVAVVRGIALSSDVRVGVMRDMVARLSGGAGKGVKEAVAAAAGTLAGLYDHVRPHPVSRMLRDDAAALSLAATGYSMLHTAAVALREASVAAVAQRHLRDITPLVTRLSRVIPAAVVVELKEKFPNVDEHAVQQGVLAVHEAWAQEPPSTV